MPEDKDMVDLGWGWLWHCPSEFGDGEFTKVCWAKEDGTGVDGRIPPPISADQPVSWKSYTATYDYSGGSGGKR